MRLRKIDNSWFCPAVEKEISEGLCWEYCFANSGGPADTTKDLKKWIEESKKFINLDELHMVCEKCEHCQWDNWFDEKKAESFLNKHIIIGISILDHEENFIDQKQMHGEITRVNTNEGIVIKLNGSNEEYKLPPDLNSIKEAPLGEYRFKSTGEIVKDPDLMTMWTIKKPSIKNRKTAPSLANVWVVATSA